MEEVGLEIASFLFVFLCKQTRLQLITHVHSGQSRSLLQCAWSGYTTFIESILLT